MNCIVSMLAYDIRIFFNALVIVWNLPTQTNQSYSFSLNKATGCCE